MEEMSLKVSSLEAALVESREKAAAAPTGQGCLNTFHAHYTHRTSSFLAVIILIVYINIILIMLITCMILTTHIVVTVLIIFINIMCVVSKVSGTSTKGWLEG